ncbi:MAG TPA: DUF4384 domain-containing protein [Gemmatimonadales bacterium]|jgi:hypothetical protein|nr:DUF4384 domain-containing protein [Gemmatimonadales bacterium]
MLVAASCAALAGLALCLGPGPARGAAPAALAAWRHASAGRPRVSLWTDRDGPYRRGERLRASFAVREPSHVLVLRVDTDGALRVLFPGEPWDDSWVRADRPYAIAPASRGFLVDDYPGVGYLFVIASPVPFDLDPIVRRDHWDYREIAEGRLHGDPYVALTELAARLGPDGDYDYDIVPYYVERRYDYPRFVCYECHEGATAAAWDPYGESCSRYRIVIYDDPYYYPYRSTGGRMVVGNRPTRPGPRYVFREASGYGGSDFVSRGERRADAGSSAPYRDRAAQAPADRRPSAAPKTTGEPELRRRGQPPNP